MTYDLVAGILWAIGVVSLLLTVVGLALRSWKLLWVAASIGILFSAAAALSIGPFVLLLVALQLGCAVALRRSFHWRGWSMLISIAILTWFLIVPFQLLVGPFLPLFFLIPIGLIAAAVATATGPSPHPDSNAAA